MGYVCNELTFKGMHIHTCNKAIVQEQNEQIRLKLIIDLFLPYTNNRPYKLHWNVHVSPVVLTYERVWQRNTECVSLRNTEQGSPSLWVPTWSLSNHQWRWRQRKTTAGASEIDAARITQAPTTTRASLAYQPSRLRTLLLRIPVEDPNRLKWCLRVDHAS